MIRINQIKIPYYDESREKDILHKKIIKMLRLNATDISDFRIIRKSVDAREKPDIYHVYTVDIVVAKGVRINNNLIKGNVSYVEDETYHMPQNGKNICPDISPVVVGMGPAGIFCGYCLAINGYKPIIIERGKPVAERIKDVESFWQTGVLNSESNVQFGEGGAGTFSDGKLNTMVKDKSGRNRAVLETLVKFGAPEEILYVNKPHIGTDILSKVVSNMRQAIIDNGGQVRFEKKLTDIHVIDNKISSITVNDTEEIQCETLVLALGHSARDTFYMLKDKSLSMEAKAFAVGVRMEHPQEMIDMSMYGMSHQDSVDSILGAADYKLTHQASNGRGVYSFCMCPGGYVVNASSEKNMLAVNGMSYSKRDGENANSAIIVTVTPDDFKTNEPLAGVEFQRNLEAAAYREGNGHIPVQLYGDFKADRASEGFGSILPNTKGSVQLSNINNILPEYICDSLREAIDSFGHKIKGFDSDDALMLGVESRTSSPIRINRDNRLQSNISGIYPCGEGAGYAGGITSAAMDGIKVYEAINALYQEA